MISFDSNFDELGRQLGNSRLPGGRMNLQVQAADFNEKVQNEGWQVSMPYATAGRTALQKGTHLVEEGAAIVIGISLGNSYFSQETMSRLFRVLNEFGSKTYVVPMDLPAEHNYRALGYYEEQIDKKIKKKGAEVKRAVRSALEDAGIESEKAVVVEWEFIRECSRYTEALSCLRTMNAGESSFKKDLYHATRQFILRQLPAGKDAESAIQTAKEYLLEELSFLLAAQDILGEERLCYMYHREWPIFERLLAGEYGAIANTDLGFLELRIENSSS